MKREDLFAAIKETIENMDDGDRRNRDLYKAA